MQRRGAVVGAAVLLVMLATWAASAGPHDLVSGDGPSRATPLDDEQPPEKQGSSPVERPEPASGGGHGSSHWVVVVAALAQVVVAAALLFAFYLVLQRLRRRGRRSEVEDEPDLEVDFEVLEPQRAAEAILSDATAQRALLLGGTPRNAIVACWHRFEVQASSIGLAREPWETSSEFTLRLLDVVAADPTAVAELGGLYREARFSDHDLDEARRGRAVAALDAVHQDLLRRQGAVVTGAR